MDKEILEELSDIHRNLTLTLLQENTESEKDLILISKLEEELSFLNTILGMALQIYNLHVGKYDEQNSQYNDSQS